MKPRFRCSYSSLWRSQNSRFRRACSVRSDKRAQTSPASPNQSSTSRCADSGESEPCTRLSGIASARSPRIVPGAAVAGFVAPIVVRTTEIADSPSSTSASVGAEVMNSTSSPKNGFSRCSA